MEDQFSEHDEQAPRPDVPSNTRALLIGVAPALVVAAGLIVGGLLYTEPVATAPAQLAASGPTVATGTTADELEITAAMQRYVDGLNAGDAALFKSALCESRNASTAGLTDGDPLESDRAQLKAVADVRVSGPTATALVTATVEGAPELGSKATQLNFVNEDGWKLC